MPNFGGHEHCEYGDMTFLFCLATSRSMCQVSLWFVPPHLKSHSARFGLHRPYGSGDSSYSNSDSNAEVPMPKFANGCFELVQCL